MEIKRHIVIQAVKTSENILIPIWDENIVFEKTKDIGNIITLKNSHTHLGVVECIYDLKTRKIEIGVELNCYPLDNNLEYKKGENVLVEKSNRVLVEATIVDIIYEEYELMIKRGKKIEKYYLHNLKDIVLDDNTLYAIKIWKPFYLLDNGTKIEYSHKLYRKG